MSNKAVVSMQNVSKRFRTTQALDDVSFEVPPGTVCALLGANGAGKSTTIRTLLGLERPDSGTSKVLRMESQKYSREIRSRVGYVAEKPALYDWMTIEETSWFAAGFYPPGYRPAFDQYCRQFDLNPSQKISELSKGTRAKVALSLALSHKPELLILDEPTSGLDPLVRREFLQSMVDVASEGRTVLLCSHQVSEVERVADLVVILVNGKLVCFEKLDELKHQTREVIITLPDAHASIPDLPGTTLSHVPFGHEHSLIIRDLDEQKLAEIRESGLAIEIRRPSLEDILLGLLRERRNQTAEP
ncbi:ABC transporter ATP-binding protein [Planctomicrobium sp. SH661]|uniref:ABC transporter ATP-binding protein n=1 Tax=Planctomicrobium sp. SH661 TaxID=3448124 RepID=UPI003F5C57C8